jgi:hypothetical protein
MYATQEKDPEGITLERQRANAHFGVVVLPDPAAEPMRIVPTKETDTEFVCVLRAVFLRVAHVLGLGGLGNSSSSEGATVHSLGRQPQDPESRQKRPFLAPTF